MARTDTLRHFLTDIANSIRNKKGTTDPIMASDFDTEIASIESGVDINDYLSDTITKGTSSTGGWAKTIKKIRSPLTIEGTDASYMFYGYQLNELPQLDTSAVTNMSYMFGSCTLLTTIPQLNTSNVIDMHYMFNNCSSLTTIPQLDTSNVTNMDSMVSHCTSLTTIPQLSTGNVANMSYMFFYCESLTTIPLIDTSNVIDIRNMFHSCPALTTLGGFQNLGMAYDTNKSANYSSYTLNLSTSSKLTHDSLMNVINNLYDIKTKGVKTQQLVIGSKNLAKLTAEEIAIATDKGWTVS